MKFEQIFHECAYLRLREGGLSFESSHQIFRGHFSRGRLRFFLFLLKCLNHLMHPEIFKL